ncbi:MAG: hypothetical protein LH614_03600 [Pyrinomonadaceae bacterium]|nr:hypothetical protein [Pyrinomonadaceae bacterium]
MALVNQARVSSNEQNLDVQLDKSKDCRKSFRKRKARQAANVPLYKPVWNMSEKGDILVVARLDRLVRSTLHLRQITD